MELIYANPCSKPPARIQRWMLRLQQYDFEVVYKRRSGNPADFLSRHPPTKVNFRRKIAEEYVNFVTQSVVPPALSLEEIARETGADPGLRALSAALKTDCWNSDIVKLFPVADPDRCHGFQETYENGPHKFNTIYKFCSWQKQQPRT